MSRELCKYESIEPEAERREKAEGPGQSLNNNASRQVLD